MNTKAATTDYTGRSGTISVTPDIVRKNTLMCTNHLGKI